MSDNTPNKTNTTETENLTSHADRWLASPQLLLDVFRRAARRVPAYKTLLDEAGVRAERINSIDDFQQLPIMNKHNTFQRFPVDQLALDGKLGPLTSVLTSSGHSGVFAFGLYDPQGADEAGDRIDDMLDSIFHVKSRSTLLVNCLPMGVKIYTRVCTLGETSVRSDMAAGLVEGFGEYFDQVILVGDAAFIKHLLEFGQDRGIDWKAMHVHAIVGEEPLAENAREYLEGLMGIDVHKPQTGLVISSMGVGELGLNLFFEAPPASPLIRLRRALLKDPDLREHILGARAGIPLFFTYNPDRIYVEFEPDGNLVITMLDPTRRIPMVRYAPGDHGRFLQLEQVHRPLIENCGLSFDQLRSLPIVLISGRGKYAMAGDHRVYPEDIKEGIYHNHSLARLATANFRIVPGTSHAVIRIQLGLGIAPEPEFNAGFSEAIARYVEAPFKVQCEEFDSFGSGMSLDYERKFAYLR